MRTGRRIARACTAALAALALLAGCDMPPKSSPVPPSRPAGLAPTGDQVTPRSAASADLARYYAAVQNDLLTRGLLRTDGGGPDTPYDAEDLERNFINIAFFNEYDSGAGLPTGGRSQGFLSRWPGPVKVGVEFGPSVPLDQRAKDKGAVENYAARLGRLTGHPVSAVTRGANFHVFVAGLDDGPFVQERLRHLVPGIRNQQLDLFVNLPRDIYCFVFAAADPDRPYGYMRAVALIRAEHPDLVRLSCVHEEMAQGLGLANDSPAARPSIFNDDDEFALLTDQDEKLLSMLYDPRLTPGMSAEEARPVIRIIAREKLGLSL
ncbi:DUF2927 domain-containing protein [Ruegeria pomeroyi]|nr:DUF2927 domain-containing protein [Ruegeria pomeroyi]